MKPVHLEQALREEGLPKRDMVGELGGEEGQRGPAGSGPAGVRVGDLWNIPPQVMASGYPQLPHPRAFQTGLSTREVELCPPPPRNTLGCSYKGHRGWPPSVFHLLLRLSQVG